jgi:hypothetical protein
MKTIALHIQQGIHTLAELRDALATAMQLEFSTIPPYLCAQWSINSDPSGVAGMIRNVVIQEMYHFALAGNMVAAIGGAVKVNIPSFIPHYPTHTLPGGIRLAHAVDLKPLSSMQLEVFLGIEKPEFPPVGMALAARPATIGAFYDTIKGGFSSVTPAIVAGAPFVPINEVTNGTPIADPPNGQITSIADALAAIDRIKREGEGTAGDPDQPPDDVADGEDLAHYYVFEQIRRGKQLIKNAAGHWVFDGPAIQMPTVFDFHRSTASPDPSLAFNATLGQLLGALEQCWVPGGAAPDFADMFALKSQGTVLIKAGITPTFA